MLAITNTNVIGVTNPPNFSANDDMGGNDIDSTGWEDALDTINDILEIVETGVEIGKDIGLIDENVDPDDVVKNVKDEIDKQQTRIADQYMQNKLKQYTPFLIAGLAILVVFLLVRK